MTCRDGECVQRTPDGEFIKEGPILPETLTADHYTAQIVERSREGFEADTQRSLTEAAALCAEGVEQIEVTVTLPFLAYDFTKLRGLSTDDPEFQRIRRERQAQLAKAQAPYDTLLREAGATPVDWGESFNFVDVFTDPCKLDALAALEGARGVELTGGDHDAYVSGLEQRNALGESVAALAGLTGRYGGMRNNTGRVKYSVIEKSNVNIGHESFRDGPLGTMNRIVDTDRCRLVIPNGRSCELSATTSSATHGTEVTSAILSDWRSGQNANITSLLANKYSRIAPKSIVHFYKTNGPATRPNLRRAIKESVWYDGADIINLSRGPTESYCKNDSLNNVREAVWLATDAGLLTVVAGGNEGQLSGCNVNNYGTFPDSMTIGGTTDSGDQSTLDSNTRHYLSSQGTTQVSLAGGAKVNTRFIDLMVNFRHNYLAGAGTTNVLHNWGTSFSAPTVAGAAGLLLHWSWRRGGLNGLQHDPYTWRVLMALMGDGRSTNGSYLYSIDPAYGFGNLRLINLDADLGTTGGWGIRRINLVQGDTFDISIADGTPTPNAKGWKFAAFIDQNYYGGSPDMTYQLIDKCPVGGGVRVIRTAAKYPLRARMRITNAEAASVFNGCLYVRTRVNHANGVVPLYLADYYYSNGRSIHAAN